MAKYAYRAAPELEPGKDIMAKNPDSATNLINFIKTGTVASTKYISTTQLLGVAVNKYAIGMKKAGKVIPGKRAPIVLVDLDKIDGQIHNCADGKYLRSIINTELNNPKEKKDKMWNMIISRSEADREIILEDRIPQETYRTIPPMLVDILDAFEQINTVDSRLCMQTVNNMLMENKESDLMEIINNMEFNQIEKKFISDYYENMNNMHQVAENFKNYLTDETLHHLAVNTRGSAIPCITAIKSQIVKNILANEEFQKTIETKKKVLQKEQEGSATDTNFKKMIDEYYTIPEGLSDTTAKKQKDVNDSFIGRPNISIKVKKDEIKEIPVGVDYNIEDGRITSFETKARTLRKPERDSLHLYPHFETMGMGELANRIIKLSVNQQIYEQEKIDNGKNALEDCMSDEKSRKELYDKSTKTVKDIINQEKEQKKDLEETRGE